MHIIYTRSHLRPLVPFAALFACLRSMNLQLCVSAHQSDARAQCTFTLDHTLVLIKRTSRLLNLCMITLDRTLPVLERISTVSNNRPGAAKYKVFYSFLVYCYFSLLVYFLVPACYLLLVVFNFYCFWLFYFQI